MFAKNKRVCCVCNRTTCFSCLEKNNDMGIKNEVNKGGGFVYDNDDEIKKR